MINGQFIGQILTLSKFYERLAVLPRGYVNLPPFCFLMERFANTFPAPAFEQLYISLQGSNKPVKSLQLTLTYCGYTRCGPS